MPTIVAFGTGWLAREGGVNSFNTDLCIALAALDNTVVCMTPSCDASDIQHAAKRNVTLIPLSPGGNAAVFDSPGHVTALLSDRRLQPDLLIGHDVITGPIVLAVADGTRACKLLFHHMNYVSYKTLEGTAEEADSKNALQRTVFSGAHIIAAVGPKLFTSAMDIVRSLSEPRPRVVEVVPGLPVSELVTAPSQTQFLIAGRLSGRAARLKQVQLAAAAFGTAVAKYPVAMGQDPVLTLVGAADVSQSPDDLRNLSIQHAGRHVTILDLPFILDREAFMQRLSRQTAAMLLSVHEGFGLVGWEAIGAGVPLILSKNSGLHELLHKKHGGSATGCVHSIDVRGGAALVQADIDAVAAAMADIAREPERARRDAHQLISQLTKYSWKEAAKTVLGAASASGFVVTASETHAAGPRARQASRPQVAASPLVLFDIYDPSCDQYCLERSRDERVNSLQRSRHVWLWGTSGVGKTTAIRRSFMRAPGYCYISLAACFGLDVHEIFTYVLNELSERLATAPVTIARHALPLTASVSGIIDLLNRNPSAVVHIDEVPLSASDGHRHFCSATAALIIDEAASSGPGGATLALSSIARPEFNVATQKVLERLSAIEVPPWHQDELTALSNMISVDLGLGIPPSDVETIVTAANGSPRFVKGCFRKLLAFPGSSKWPLARIIADTQAEVVS